MNDNELRDLFSTLNRDLSGSRFSADVAQSISRQRLTRSIVIGLAVALGLSVALVPLGDLIVVSARTIIAATVQVGVGTLFD